MGSDEGKIPPKVIKKRYQNKIIRSILQNIVYILRIHHFRALLQIKTLIINLTKCNKIFKIMTVENDDDVKLFWCAMVLLTVSLALHTVEWKI